jgi:hypothetical protein
MSGAAVLQLLPGGLCGIAAGAIYRQSLGSAPRGGWRRRAAASIPAAYTFLLLLVWVLPIQLFLVQTFDARAGLALLVLTLAGAALAACLPAAYCRLLPTEANGRIYAALGVRRFRGLVVYGDLMVRLMRWISPASNNHLSCSALTLRQRRTWRTEKIHWTMLAAVLARQTWFAAYQLAANVPMNIYPIMLQRYTRARLSRMAAHADSRVPKERALKSRGD